MFTQNRFSLILRLSPLRSEKASAPRENLHGHRPLESDRKTIDEKQPDHLPAFFEQCQMVVFVADDLGFLGPGIPDLLTELCPPQNTA